jgi:hypothetical protein
MTDDIGTGRTAPSTEVRAPGRRRSSAIGPDRPPPRIATDANKKIEKCSCHRAPTFWLLAPRTAPLTDSESTAGVSFPDG